MRLSHNSVQNQLWLLHNVISQITTCLFESNSSGNKYNEKIFFFYYNVKTTTVQTKQVLSTLTNLWEFSISWTSDFLTSFLYHFNYIRAARVTSSVRVSGICGVLTLIRPDDCQQILFLKLKKFTLTFKKSKCN